MKIFIIHYHNFITSFKQFTKDPINSILNILVIALVTAILCGTFAISKNLDKWQKNNINFPQIVVYLNSSISTQQITDIQNILNKSSYDLIKGYQYIAKQQALSELQQDRELKKLNASDLANSTNSLPNILIIKTQTTDINLLHHLVNRISNLHMVEGVDIDANYANKLNNLISFIKQASSFLILLFTLALILIIYNLIKLQILIKRDEVIVSRLIGASATFIMRPLIYYIGLQASIAVLVAYALVNCFIKFINHLFIQFGSLFGQKFLIDYLSVTQLGQIWLLIMILSIFASFAAVRFILRNNNYN